MGFGPGKGLNFTSFCKVVKTMQLVVVDGPEPARRYDVPVDWYNVPIKNFQEPVRKAA